MGDDGWDLHAVVRGCCGPARTATVDPFSSFPHLGEEGRGEEDDLLLCFPELFATQTALHELEELCKPFFSNSSQQQPQQQQLHLLSPQRSPSSSSAAPLLPTCAAGAAALPPPQQHIRQPQHRALPQTPRSKRRKNQQKRVVCQVPADGLSSDMWAWRKYGQKPIKGSPYPRGYYRCSSSKGCLARKQVERSRTDPGMFVITYTAEHNHAVPTHRNSLAGSTRQKFPPSSSAQQGVEPERASSKGGAAASSSPLSSPTAAAGLSPTTPLTSSVDDELLPPRGTGEDGEEEEEEEHEEEEDPLLVGDMEMLGEDDVLFMDLGGLRDPNATAPHFGDGFPDHFGAFPTPWMASGAATAAGGS